MMMNFETVTNQINQWKTYRDSCHQFHSIKLSYDQVKRKDIRKKNQMCSFMDPRINEFLLINSKRFPIHWCNHG